MTHSSATSPVALDEGQAAAAVSSSAIAAERANHPTFVRASAFIDEELGSPSLSSQQISQGIGVSRAVLYRAFVHVGGVKRYVDDARLDQACRILQSRCLERGIVFIAARKCGYENSTRFSRLFRTRYHETPTAMVKRLRQAAMEGP